MLAKGKSLEKDEFIFSRTRISFNQVIQKNPSQELRRGVEAEPLIMNRGIEVAWFN